MCCPSVTRVPKLAHTPSASKSSEPRSTEAVDGMSPPSNRTGFTRDTTTTAHLPGSRRSNGSSAVELALALNQGLACAVMLGSTRNAVHRPDSVGVIDDVDPRR